MEETLRRDLGSVSMSLRLERLRRFVKEYHFRCFTEEVRLEESEAEEPSLAEVFGMENSTSLLLPGELLYRTEVLWSTGLVQNP
jgi:hypothetical protein